MRVANKEIVEKRRKELALTAATLFVKNGYLKTSMRDIARQCDISVGTFYHYIRSKDDILSLFHEITSEELNKFDREKLGNLSRTSPREAIIAAIDAIISFIDKTEDVTVFWYQESRNLNPQQTELLLKREDHHIGLLRKILQLGCEQGDFELDDILLAAHNIIVLCDMWAFRRWSLRKDYNVEQFKQAQTELILSEIKAKSRWQQSRIDKNCS